MSEMKDTDETLEAALIDVLSKENATLKDEVASLKGELAQTQRAHSRAREDRERALDMADALREDHEALKVVLRDAQREAAALEAEVERRDTVARERYAALERDRDNVERIMREAGQRADQLARDLKVVLDREEMRIKFQRDRADMWQAAAADALAQLKALREAK